MMTPHYIKTKPTGMWIDLDHILVISDLITIRHEPMRSTFSITMMFREQPIIIGVHDRYTIEGYDELAQRATFTVTCASPEEITELQGEYDKLLEAWKSK